MEVLADPEAEALPTAASLNSRAMFFRGPVATAFHLGWSREFQRSKLSWWTPMLTKNFAPALR